MHIIVLGAGRIGQYVAQSLSLDGHSVVLVDPNIEKLGEVAQKIDVATKKGFATDWKLIATLMEEGPQLLLALSDNDEVNLVACQIAKSFGNVRTICRIKDSRYLGHEHLDIARLFHIDHLIFPEQLVAEQIIKIAFSQSFYHESFFHGGAILRTIQIPRGWVHNGKTLATLHTIDKRLIIALIKRKTETGYKLIFPHGKDSLYFDDEVTVIAEADLLAEIHRFFEVEEFLCESMAIIGGTSVGEHLARSAKKKEMRVKLSEASADRCYALAEELPDVAILHMQGSSFEFLQSENIASSDVFVAATPHEDKNLMFSLFAKELGSKRIISVLSDEHVIKIAEDHGISHVVSPHIITTDKILALARAEKLTSLVSLYDQQVEIMQIRVSLDSPVVGIPLSVLGPRLPQELLIAVLSSRGRIHIVGGSHILSPHDEVVVVCHPKHRQFLESIF